MADPVKNIHSKTTPEIDKIADMEFDSENVRELYTTKVIMYLLEQTVDFDSPWDRKIIDKIIEDVNNGKECIRMHLTRTSEQYHAMKKYSTCQTSTGKYTLLLKSIKQQQIIPCEESFDVVMKAHRTIGHRNKSKIYDYLCLTHVLPKWCVDIMEQVCNVCQKYQSQLSKRSTKYNEKGIVDIITLPKPDVYFKYVLIYEDMYTKYIHIRALDKKSDDELAMVLMQIFMNFGPPTILHTNKAVFRQALQTINMMCHLSCAVVMDSRNRTSHLEAVAAKILKWMTDNKTDHWSLGCQMVQWEHNNTSVHNRLSPYDMVFGHTSYTKSIMEENIEAVDEIAEGEIVGNKKLCKQCNTTLNTDLIQVCYRCKNGVHRICCEFNHLKKPLCFSCRDKEKLLVKLKSTAVKVQKHLNKLT